METLIPDFDGNTDSIQKIIDAGPDVISHNIETVKRLTPIIRTKAKYERSLEVLKYHLRERERCQIGIYVGLGRERR